jgi:glycosyltransferase involved in cell wall biosynthesis
VHLLSFYNAGPEPSPERIRAMQAMCESVEALPRLDYAGQHNWPYFRAISRRWPPRIVLRWNPAMTDAVRAVLRRKPLDLLILSQVQNLPLLDAGDLTLPILLEQFEVSTIWNRVAEARGLAWLRRQFTRSNWSHYLRQQLGNCSGVTVPSLREKAILGPLLPVRQPTIPVELVPNGVDVRTGVPARETTKKPVLIYQGSLAFPANYDAVRYFVADIMPHVLQSMPDVRLRVTGRHDGVDTRELISLASGTLELTGYLQDIRSAVASAAACIVPLRLGSGTRLKVLEAMALRTPVVATSKGVEGLDVRHGQHALIADDPQAFASQVCRVLQDAALRRQLVENARRLVVDRHSWERIGDGFNRFCERIAGVT